ncbi:MAG: hypothetical protein JWO51_1988 [Rhodospirillales bacterium]|jgi:hypothetical protein|nr:hypothetical protein [Rhodospirillales bacterium]
MNEVPLTPAIGRYDPVEAKIAGPMASTAIARRSMLFLRYAHEQGVCHHLLTPEDLFEPQVLSRVRVRGDRNHV